VLKGNVRTYTGDKYQMGDKAFYKRPDNREWKGPGRVIGQDGKVVFIRYGGIFVRVHICRLKKCNELSSQERETNENQPQLDVEVQEIPQNTVESNNDEDTTTELEVQSNETDMCAPNNIVGQAINSVNANNIKPGQYIASREEHRPENAADKVISRAGKATGKHRYWFNIDYLGTGMDAKSIDLSQVEELEIIENPIEGANVVDEVMFCHNLSFDSAKQA
jgi:hypothetical protein